jgi:hypothetical protein
MLVGSFKNSKLGKYFFIFIIGMMLTQCKRIDIAYGTSGCIREKIKSFSKYTCKTGGNVMEYEFDTKLVYVFKLGNCDEILNAEVLDASCNTLGYIYPNQTINIVDSLDFNDVAIFKRIIWEDK